MSTNPLNYKTEIDLGQKNNSHTLAHDFIASLRRPSLRVLEIGCAVGDLGACLRAEGHRVVGIEPDADAARLAAARLDEVFVGTGDDWFAQAGGRLFDVVLFGDVLEHMADPASALRAAAAHLDLDGHVIVSVPNVAHGSVRAMLLDGRWDLADRGILDRTHLRWFTRRTLLELLSDNGLVAVRLTCTVLSIRQAARMSGIALSAGASALVEAWDGGPDCEAFQWLVLARPSLQSAAILRDANSRLELEIPDGLTTAARAIRRTWRRVAALLIALGFHRLIGAWQGWRRRRRAARGKD